MAIHCSRCGALAANAAGFCGSCGTPLGTTQSSATAQPTIAPPASKSSNTLMKVGISLVVIIFVGGAAAAVAGYYAFHRLKEKAHNVSQALGASSGTSSSTDGGMLATLTHAAGDNSASADTSGPTGDLCRFVSKEEVGTAIGAPITRTHGDKDGCVYYAHGDPATMTNKHLDSMMGQIAGDVPASARKQMSAITGAFFQQTQKSDKNLSAEAATGEVPVLTVSFTSGNAEMEMKLTRSAWGRISSAGMHPGKAVAASTGEISGVGDEAYQTADSGLVVRKGQTVIHLMYPECPCSTQQITPLATKIAAQL